jgi:hypothetical protein
MTEMPEEIESDETVDETSNQQDEILSSADKG